MIDRKRMLAASFLFLLASMLANADDRAPQPASQIRYVKVENASVYAGPGEDYYPTSILKKGDTVEVFERTEDGWLAVRPPSGSFSWLPAAQGFLLPGGRIIEVTDSSAVSWIGTVLGTAKQYRWQVRLNSGEQLAVIGEQAMTDPQTSKKNLWFKVTPPNGEFRWIQEQATSLESPKLSEPKSIVIVDSKTQADGQEVVTDSASPLHNQVVTANYESSELVDEENQSDQAIGSRLPSGRPQVQRNRKRANDTNSRDNPHQWDQWHAMEFKDGAFSFPGIARMFGMEPPARVPASQYDPFDLAAAPTRAIDAAQEPGFSGGETLASNRPRGWRDPRTLRSNRNQPNETSLFATAAAGQPDAGLATVYLGNSEEAVGTSVVAASATAPIGAINSSLDSEPVDDANWYGIQQATPSDKGSGPRTLETFQADLSEIQIRLSEMVVGPEQTWNLAPLADRTRYLVANGATAIERGEARLLLDRIEGFADVARRASQLGMAQPSLNSDVSTNPPPSNVTASVMAAAVRWASPLGINTAPIESTSSVAPRFDATGWVVPVHSSAREMPTHALTNDAGKIIVYLTPAAGVNLSRYQSQAIGVYGLRGYLPQLKANHIQVQRAVRLQ